MKFDHELHPTILVGVGVFTAIIMLIGAVLIFQWHSKIKVKKNAVDLTRQMAGLDQDNEPLRPTGMPPNLSKLKVINEEQITKGRVLGEGAFGTVYHGLWKPEGHDKKIPVAIKVLHNSTKSTDNDFLDEAHIMASVNHPNLVHLLAVCMTSQMMLITQLMPNDCLLKFVKEQKNNIDSKIMLNWCKQIACGMAYLEEHRLVHRDLAARNILVHSRNCVKITDFGLAKLLEIDEEYYKAEAGKVPFKWLAIECIEQRIFTHKSDVWAFGVTIWELLTYGEKPYGNTPSIEVPKLVRKGEKLPQPPICSLEVYMLMVKCWNFQPESRPSFKELKEGFAKMCRDPGRYLAIKGDKYFRLPAHIIQVCS